MSPGVVVEYIRYRVDEDRRDGFEDAYVAAGAVLARSPQCVDYDLARSADAPACYVLRIRWTSAEDHLQGFRGGALFAEFFAANDELLGTLFVHMDPSHPRFVAMWLGEVFGGPARYTAERGGYPHMLRQHVGKAITEAQRRRWVNLLLDAADEVELPADPEFRAAFSGYLEWGTRLAVRNSAPDARPVTRAPVPQWGWGVAPPYVG